MFLRGAVVSSLVGAAAASAPTVQAAWDNHFDAFGSQNLEQIMGDYMESSVVEHYDYTSGSLVTASGLNEIRSFFERLFDELSDLSTMTAPVVEVTDAPARQTYLIWAVSSSNIYSATDTFLFAPDNSILRQQVVSTHGSEPASYNEVSQMPQQPSQNLVPTDESYAKASVQDAWDNHFAAFGAQDLRGIMQDYTEISELRAFDHHTGVLKVATGLAEIQGFFEELFHQLSDLSGLAAPVVHVTDQAAGKQVFLVWSCPSSGIVSATDSFVFDDQNRITRQNIVFTSQGSMPELV